MERKNFKTHDVEQGSQEWKNLRLKYKTASQAGAAMGVGHKQNGEVTEYLEGLFAFGHEVEEAARPIVEPDHFNFNALETPTGTCEVDGVPLLASLDGFDGEKIWECKSYGYNGKISKDAQMMIDGEVPEKHFWQVQHQMLVFGVDSAILTAATIDKDGFLDIASNIEIKADPDAQARLIERYKEQVIVKADDDLEKLYSSLEALREQRQAMDDEIKAIESEIKGKAESFGASEVIGHGFKVSLVERKGSVDYKKIPELKGVDLDQYRKPPSAYYQIKPVNQSA